MRLNGEWRRAFASLIAIGGAFSTLAVAQSSSEPAVKAGFVYNFAKFTEWPSGALTGPQFSVCLIGADPLGAVSALLDGRPLQGRTIVVRRQVRGDDIKSCSIVFITEVDERRQAEALRLVHGLPVLTIGDADGFVDAGGQIGLVTADNRIQFEVNLETAQRAGLKIHSQLLNLARKVKGRS
jgi:hypothetical protein